MGSPLVYHGITLVLLNRVSLISTICDPELSPLSGFFGIVHWSFHIAGLCRESGMEFSLYDQTLLVYASGFVLLQLAAGDT